VEKKKKKKKKEEEEVEKKKKKNEKEKKKKRKNWSHRPKSKSLRTPRCKTKGLSDFPERGPIYLRGSLISATGPKFSLGGSRPIRSQLIWEPLLSGGDRDSNRSDIT
jgi:hypothetical protein